MSETFPLPMMLPMSLGKEFSCLPERLQIFKQALFIIELGMALGA